MSMQIFCIYLKTMEKVFRSGWMVTITTQDFRGGVSARSRFGAFGWSALPGNRHLAQGCNALLERRMGAEQ